MEWIGEIPAHWEVQTIRAVTELKSEKNQPDLPVLSVYREYGVIPKDSRDDNHNATSLDTSNYKVVDVDDLVINKMKAWQGSMGVSTHHGIVSPAYIICRINTKKVISGFLHYLLRSKLYIGVYNSLSYGIRIGQWDMHYEDFKKILIPLPEAKEQKRIVHFLDQKISEIDEVINKKQRLIELLKELKQTTIAEAVTKGLNPNVPMRDSGVEWIGEIPAHWEVQTIRAVTELKSEKNQPDLPVLSVYREYGVIPKDSRDDNHNATSLDTSNYKVVDVDDLVINKMKAWQGSMGVSTHHGIVSPAYIICRINTKKVISGFLHYLLRSKLYIGVYNSLSYGIRIGQWDMHYEDFKKILIPLPEAKEQKRIVHFLDQKISEIDEVINKKQRLIELLKELKQTTIAEAVTGKIKV